MGKLMVGVSGIRGIVGEDITPEILVKYINGFAEYIGGKTVVLGRDSRVTGEMISSIIKGVLMAKGYIVYDVGIVPTPTVLLMVDELKADGGIIVTASHNPMEWNALKLVSNKGMFLTKSEGEQFLKLAEKENFSYKKYDNIGKVIKIDNAVDIHIEKILNLVDVEKIRNRKFKVVLDCVNGAGGVITPYLLEALNCEYTVLNKEPTGIFAHEPEPIPANLKSLEKEVLEKGADIGFAHDPDVDRLAVVSDNGKAIGEEYTLAFAVSAVLEKKRGDVVCNLSTSRMSEDIAKKYGVQCVRTPVGEINVSEKMKEIGGVIGGEGNGGVIYPELHFTRDAPMGVALILDYLATKKKKVSEIVDELPKYIMRKEKLSFNSIEERKKALEVLDTIEFEGCENINKIDGIKFDFEAGWLHIRPSGTEPIIRIFGEAKDDKWLLEKMEYLKGLFNV